MSKPSTPQSVGTSDAERTFRDRLTTVSRRWRTRRVLEGLSIAAVIAAIAVAAGILYLAMAGFEASAVSVTRIAVYAVIAVALLVAVLPRLLRGLSPPAVARHIETCVGDLDALVVSAAEVGERARRNGEPIRDGSLEHTLLQRAASACEGSQAVRKLELARLWRGGAALAAIALVAAAVVLWGSAPVQHGLALLFAPSSDVAHDNPYRLGVEPGDVARVAGEDQVIAALPEGFRPEAVELVSRGVGDKAWTTTSMTTDGASGRHETLLVDLQEPKEYYARSGVIESARHRIDVTPRPRVSRIDLRYEYPRRTGRAPELVRDGGPINGVRGTQVELRIIPDRPVAAGALVLDGQRRIPLTASGDELRARIDLSEDGRYRVELPAGSAGLVAASAEHSIRVHEDRRPTVTLEWPGRDTKVTSVEEIDITVQAEDDVALRDLALVLNINGAEDRVLRFVADEKTPAQLRRTHTLSLEKLSLAPGDLISYHARASDAAGNPQRVVTTDLYFLDVRPFEQRFRRAAGGGGGGGGQGQDQTELTAQQRSLVVALFKLRRDQGFIEPSLFRERIATLEQAQARIRARAEAIARRIRPRGFISENESYRDLAKEMRGASEAMVEAESQLGVEDLELALPSARQALLHLQRADAAFRDVQVAMQRGGDQGGQQQNQQTELANLFQLEMDKFRNPYEDLQRGQWNPQSQDLDDALDKLRELAHRQQREIERAHRRGQRATTSGANSQQALADEVEELRRELERLTRQRDQAQAAQAESARQRLRDARRAMERAARNGDTKAGEQALKELRQLRQDLERRHRERLARGVEDARTRAQSAARQQRDIERRLDRPFTDGVTDPQGVDELVDRKRTLARELRDLGENVERLRQQAHRERPEETEDLEAAERTLRDGRLDERMAASARGLERDPQSHSRRGGEHELTRNLERLSQQLASAEQALEASPGTDTAEALERLRGLVRGLKADQQRLADAANQRGGASNQPSDQPRGSGQAQAGGGATGNGGGSATAGRGFTDTSAGGGYGRNIDVEISGLRQQMLDRLGELDALAETHPELGDVAQNVDALVAALARADVDGTDLQALRDRQAALLARLQNLEADLRNADTPTQQSLTARSRVDIAPRYRHLVERYYRNLSESGVDPKM